MQIMMHQGVDRRGYQLMVQEHETLPNKLFTHQVITNESRTFRQEICAFCRLKPKTYVFIANNSKRDTKVKKTSFATSNTDISGKRAFCPVTSNNDTNSGEMDQEGHHDRYDDQREHIFILYIHFLHEGKDSHFFSTRAET